MPEGQVTDTNDGRWQMFEGRGLPKCYRGQVTDSFSNIAKENYLMQIADFLKVNIKIEVI